MCSGSSSNSLSATKADLDVSACRGSEDGSSGESWSIAVLPSGDLRSAPVETGQCCLRQSMKVQIEADQRRRCVMVFGIRQLIDINRKHRDLVTVRLVAGRRTRATIPIRAEIGSALDRALGHQL